MVQIHLHSRDQASGSKGNSSCYVDPDGLARFGRGYEAPAIELHDVIFHCHEGKATVARQENTHRDALVFDDLLYHCILRSRRKGDGQRYERTRYVTFDRDNHAFSGSKRETRGLVKYSRISPLPGPKNNQPAEFKPISEIGHVN